jgi:hypothetical protein
MTGTLTRVLLSVVLWAIAAVAIVAINANTNVFWNAQGGYLLAGLTVVAAWIATMTIQSKET